MFKFNQNVVAAWQKYFQNNPFGIQYIAQIPGELDYDLLDAIKEVEIKTNNVGEFLFNNKILKGPESLYNIGNQNPSNQNISTNVFHKDDPKILEFKKYLQKNGLYNGPINGVVDPDFINGVKKLESFLIEAIKFVNPSADVSRVSGSIWNNNELLTTVEDVENAISILQKIKKRSNGKALFSKTSQANLDAIDYTDIPMAVKFVPNADDKNETDINQNIGKHETLVPGSDERFIQLARLKLKYLFK